MADRRMTLEEKKSIPNWSNQKPFVVVEPMLRLPWGGVGRSHFACGFCMKLFEVGDKARWVLMPGRPNTFVCEADDGPDVVERWHDRWDNVIKPILQRWGE